MAKYKVCPACSEKNAPSSLSCSKCDMDLSTVKITDSEAEERAAIWEPSKEQSSSEPALVKVCDCGAVNPAQARKCTACGEDLSDVIATPQSVPEEVKCQYILSSVSDDSLFRVPCGDIIIGREHGMRECLATKQFVSRVHARLSVENGDLYIENLSTTNFTYVNNIRIPQGKVKLNINDEIGLGGISVNGVRQKEAAYFVVGLSV